MSDYKQKLLDPRWQRRRLEILSRDEWRCRLCADAESTLHVHHLRYERAADPWDYPDTALATLCAACHEELHLAKIGDAWLESLIVGGAPLTNIYGLLYAFTTEFVDGPDPSPLPRERWQDMEDAVNYAILAVRRGTTGPEISAALDGLRRE